jgi:hypothetical protein
MCDVLLNWIHVLKATQKETHARLLEIAGNTRRGGLPPDYQKWDDAYKATKGVIRDLERMKKEQACSMDSLTQAILVKQSLYCSDVKIELTTARLSDDKICVTDAINPKPGSGFTRCAWTVYREENYR